MFWLSLVARYSIRTRSRAALSALCPTLHVALVVVDFSQLTLCFIFFCNRYKKHAENALGILREGVVGLRSYGQQGWIARVILRQRTHGAALELGFVSLLLRNTSLLDEEYCTLG